ncbi:MAG: hypothetical protein SAL07_11485 [Oscillatoria sp. PMC 1051.18]|nr:hypothetical protein [Oscillatoria sp. PMC 1050.18]MEC5030529.1 hypothetical protein [Oscillatoria sp. PMC 1051.18]
MDISPDSKIDLSVAQTSNKKLKQREALENAYGNFVEPHVNRWMEINTQSLAEVPVTSSGFYCVSGWLLLTVLYCVWMRFKK